MVLRSLHSFWTSDTDPTNTPELKPDSGSVFLTVTQELTLASPCLSGRMNELNLKNYQQEKY